jgi:hypothetical protein
MNSHIRNNSSIAEMKSAVVEYDEEEDGADNGFGDDFDDFEEGGKDAEFGDFDDGFQESQPDPPPPSQPVAPSPFFVSCLAKRAEHLSD